MQNRILTIIVTYNGNQWIEKCIASLKASTVTTDILVIDNASSDDTTKLVAAKFPSIQCIALKNNEGFGQANNIGLKIAVAKKYDFAFLINQDAWVATDCLQQMLVVANDNKQLGIVSPYHLSYDGITEEKYFKDFVLSQYAKGFKGDKEQGKVKEFYFASFIHAAAWLLPIVTVRRIGGFDPLFFYTGEDNDYVQRLHHRGLKIGFVPAAKFYHQGSNAGLLHAENNEMLFRNTEILKFKNPAASTAGVVALLAKNIIKTRIASKKEDLGSLMQHNVFKQLMKQLPSLLKSRKTQLFENAYL